MSDKVVLVTGGSRGIGQAIVQRFVEDGDTVVFFHQREGSGQATVDSCAKGPGKVFSQQVDVSEFEKVSEAVAAVAKDHGALDVLVNNAGVTRDNVMMRLAEEDWDLVIDTNLKGAFAAIKAASRPMMKKRAGSIVNISSVVGLTGNAGQSNYAASKAGLLGLTKSVAKELSSRNITCNAVCPGFIETDMTKELSEEQSSKIKESIPLGKLGSGQDIAEAVFFLASDSARYITGQTLAVDGGMVM
jgi:3-oxoacyl-[acyl-carrier protein] reductase